MKPGDKVKYSEKCKRSFELKNPNRTGVFVRVNKKDNEVVLVKWDGAKIPTTIHINFIELINEQTQ